MSQELLSRVVRYLLIALGIAGLVLTFGFFTGQSWAFMLIPWELNRLAGIFLASICAASAIPMLWIAMTREYAAIMGGAINFSVMFAGFAAFSFQAYLKNPRQPLLLFGLYCIVGLVFSLALVWFARRQTFRDARPMPRLVRYSFVGFVVILAFAGTTLALQQPNIWPWQLTPQQSTLYGWIFLGAATYFIYGFLRPVWGNATGQLMGFFAYDVVLLPPFFALLFGTEPFLLTNLVFFIVALIYSAALAVYYLAVNRATRIDRAARTVA